MPLAKSRKGIALPLETVVLLILAAVVLGAMLAFFLGIFTPTDLEQKRLRNQISICNEIFSKDPTCKSQDAIAIAENKLIRGENPDRLEICKTGISGCNPSGSKTPGENCIATCCRAFCPAG
jgi:hypothetical protein